MDLRRELVNYAAVTRTARSPDPTSAPRATVGEGRLAVARRKLQPLKQQVTLSLVGAGGSSLTLRVILLLYASESMAVLYSKSVMDPPSNE